jgi:hypothetical protein
MFFLNNGREEKKRFRLIKLGGKGTREFPTKIIQYSHL